MSKIIGIAVAGTVIYVILKKYSQEFAVISQICAVILILFLAYPYLCDMLDMIQTYSEKIGIDNTFFSILIKSLGLAVVSQFSSDLCRDNGSAALASQIEFAGKLMMIITAMPVIESIIELTVRIIDHG